jgi:hypothetical protein
MSMSRQALQRKAENVFCFFCEWFLMVKLFKKYWPVRGSFWNKEHLDPKKRSELEIIIQESWTFTQYHLPIIVCFLVISVFTAMAEKIPSYQKWGCFGFMTMEFYALAIHSYNRILAARRLQLLPPTIIDLEAQREETKLKEWRKDNHSKGPFTIMCRTIESHSEPDKNVFSVVFVHSYDSISPWLSSLSEAIAYIAHLERTLGRNTLKIQQRLWTKELNAINMFKEWEQQCQKENSSS